MTFDELIRGACLEEHNCNCLMCRSNRIHSALTKCVLEAVPQYKARIPMVFDPTSSEFHRFWGRGGRPISIGMLERITERIKHATEQLQEAPRRTLYCVDCGEFLYKKDSILLNHSSRGAIRLCKSCSMHYGTCSNCGGSHSRQSQTGKRAFSEVEGQLLCNSCLPKVTSRCEHCGRLRLKSSSWADITHYLIDQGSVRANSNTVYRVCTECARSQIVNCRTCGREMLLYLNPTRHCWACAEQNVNIHRFNYKPKPKFLKTKAEGGVLRDDTLFFGMEIEMQPYPIYRANGELLSAGLDRENMANFLLKHLSRDEFYIKHDGSIRDGIELVTHPFTWSWLKEAKPLFLEIFRYMDQKQYACDKTGHCGFHVHMTKKAFTTYHLYKFIQFVFDPKHIEFIRAVSGRTVNWEYAKVRQDDAANKVWIAKNKRNASGQRHSAVNLMNEETVEVRIFGGPPNYDALMKNMEFCKSLYEYTKDISAKNMKVVDYWEYLNKRVVANQYCHLINYIKVLPKLNKVLGISETVARKAA